MIKIEKSRVRYLRGGQAGLGEPRRVCQEAAGGTIARASGQMLDPFAPEAAAISFRSFGQFVVDGTHEMFAQCHRTRLHLAAKLSFPGFALSLLTRSAPHAEWSVLKLLKRLLDGSSRE
jgi:hypothetical protein